MDFDETDLPVGLTRAERDAEAIRLVRAFRETGDFRCRDRVYYLFAPLARLTLRRISHTRQDEPDLVQEARCALLEAIGEFDERIASFSTFAISKMRFACLEYLRRITWGSRRMSDERRACEAREIAVANGEELTPEEVLNGGIQRPQASLAPISMDSVLRACGEPGEGDTSRERCLLDTLASAVDCEFEALNRLLNADLDQQVEALPPRERQLMRDYYWAGKTFKLIGIAMGISESRVFQLHHQAMLRLRQVMYDDPEEHGPILTPSQRRARRPSARVRGCRLSGDGRLSGAR